MKAHLTTSCSTRPECPSAAQSCSMTLGIRSKFILFVCECIGLGCVDAGGAGERLEVFFGMGFPEREDQPERTFS